MAIQCIINSYLAFCIFHFFYDNIIAIGCIYNSLVQPHFDYCSVVWGNCNKTLSRKLQKLQNRAARMLTSPSYDANADDLIARLGWKKLDVQVKFKTAIMV